MEGADGPADMAIDADQQRLEEEVAENIQEQLQATTVASDYRSCRKKVSFEGVHLRPAG